MHALSDVVTSWPEVALPVGGFIIGMLFGTLLDVTNYCVMGAISDWHLSGHTGRLGAVAVAAVTAILGAQVLDFGGVIDLSKSMYLGPRINWAGALGGGLLFGYGMVYAGGCPSRALVRAGGGDVRGLVVLTVLAIAAYATIGGILGRVRIAIDGSTALDVKRIGASSQNLSDLFGLSGLAGPRARVVAVAVVALPMLAFAVRIAKIQTQPRNLIAGIGVGILAVAGWILTGLAADEFAAVPLQPVSLTFVRPVADAIDWIERSTALGLPGFGAASVFGVITGAFLARWTSGSVRFASFADAADLKRHLSGAIAMGIGGVLALGCTIGQGVTGISTLSVQSLIACAGIIGGGVMGLSALERNL